MPNKFIKGVLVQFMEAFLLPLPNLIFFQYNPESVTHTWTQATGGAATSRTPAVAGGSNPLAVSGYPGETFSFTLAMDASDTIADGNAVTSGIATVSGIYTRLAALEMLQYPVTGGGAGLLTGSVSVGLGGLTAGLAGTRRSVPSMQLPTVLFAYGPGRIVPVKVTGLTITEKLYDALLNPTHAEAVVSLKVLTPQELDKVNGPLKQIAKGAYVYSHGLRQALAIANLANASDTVIGWLG
jgi:hypothetical protein